MSYPYQKDSFDQTCDYCGAVFQVNVPGMKGHEESEEYLCPECCHVYSVRASLTPRTSLVSARTDGRTNNSPSIKALLDRKNEDNTE